MGGARVSLRSAVAPDPNPGGAEGILHFAVPALPECPAYAHFARGALLPGQSAFSVSSSPAKARAEAVGQIVLAHRALSPGAFLGMGPSPLGASAHAVCRALEPVLPRDGTPELLVGWTGRTPGEVNVLAALQRVRARLTLRRLPLPEDAPGRWVAAALTLPGPAVHLETHAYGPGLGTATSWAFDRLLRAVYEWTFVGTSVAQLPLPAWAPGGGVPGVPWAEEPADDESFLASVRAWRADVQTRELPGPDGLGGVYLAWARLTAGEGPTGCDEEFTWAHPSPPRETELAPCPTTLAPLSRLYHLNSTIASVYRTADFMRAPETIGAETLTLNAQPYRTYPFATQRYTLPDVRQQRTRPLEECVLNRRSSLPLTRQVLPACELAHLLYFSCGVTAQLPSRTGALHAVRAAPSGGGLYPVDVFVLARQVDGVGRGAYYYHPGVHRLDSVNLEVDFAEVAARTAHPERVSRAAALIVLAASLGRNQWKYRERGYRLVWLDAGHIAQNVLLAATGLGRLGHPLMGFVDGYFDRLLGLDGVQEVTLYVLMIGTPGRPPPVTGA